MDSSKPTFDLLVDQVMVGLSAFPAHATEKTNDFHEENQPPISETYNTKKKKAIPFQIQRFWRNSSASFSNAFDSSFIYVSKSHNF